jgi:nucleoside phosphorylase
MATAARNFRHHDYTVAWVCALPFEMAAAEAMLDERHSNLPTNQWDHNTYALGRIGAHNVVIACLPLGVHGPVSAATVTSQILSTFTLIRFGLMVGIGGGVPSKRADIRLGDVVVSKPTRDFGGVVQYDFGKTINQGRFERIGALNKPPQVLLTAIAKLQADHISEASRIPYFLSEVVAKHPQMRDKFTYRGEEQDRLFDVAYDHSGSKGHCGNCETQRLLKRQIRDEHHPIVHYGLIASGNRVIKHGGTRDKLAQEFGIFCFEREAAGLMDNFPCLVIRGICNYADSHSNKQWQEYAAVAAAAYAKELLSVIHTRQVTETPVAASATDRELPASPDTNRN